MATSRHPHLSLRWGFFVAYSSALAADARDRGQPSRSEHPSDRSEPRTSPDMVRRAALRRSRVV
jgi:hypothetical protein